MKLHLSNIDGLRGFLALYVFFFHASVGQSLFMTPLNGLNMFFEKGVNSPYYFFVISGFLIFYSYLKNLNQTDSRQTQLTAQYFIKRIFRIFPVLWFLLFFYVVKDLTPLDGRVWKNAFLLTGFAPFELKDLTLFVTWSLFVEETFYVTVPFFAQKMNLQRSILGLLFFMCTYFLWYHFKVEAHHYAGKRWDIPFVTFHYFFSGITIYFLFKTDFFAREFWKKYGAIFLDLTTLIVFSLAAFSTFQSNFLLGSLLLITALVPESYFSKLFWQTSFLKWAGVRCYSIYMVHNLILVCFNKPPFAELMQFFPQNNFGAIVRLLIELLAVCLASELLFQAIENPFIKLGKKITRQIIKPAAMPSEI